MEHGPHIPPFSIVKKFLEDRKKPLTKNKEILIKNRALIHRTLEAAKGKEVSEKEVSDTIKWLEKVSN
ncbi:MAG: hypothetical protein ACFFDC_09435, partial [Promethearchaeota archaeon]